jgi:putative oxidoreductase
MSRLFLRLFTGVMFLQFGIRQIINFDNIVPEFQGYAGMSPDCSIAVLVTVELLCAVFIMFGLLTRLAVLPPLVLMFVAEDVILQSPGHVADQLFNFQPGYPLMFMGIFIYMFLAGPGKISLDYLIAINITEEKSESDVLDKA